jgi:RNA polymerase sigma-70 factor (ECF subfamily)
MSAPASEQRLAEAARGGDEDAFRALIEPHRGVLFAHCYRMLGSPHDAEDALQEVLLRAWRGLPGFRLDAPMRPWLFRIATNVCLDAVAKRPHRLLTAAGRPPAAAGDGPGTPLVESVWLEPYPDERHDAGEAAPGARYEQRESVELAFVAALQHLPARQRAVLLLRDVLGFSAREVAEALETTAASVNSALQRARGAVVERVPARSQQETLRSLGDARVRELVQRYVDAWERNDIEAIRALLVEDAIFAMPPYPSWWRGRDALLATFAAAGAPRLRHIETRANAQPAVAWYIWHPDREAYIASALEVFTMDGPRIAQITAFVSPALFPRFGLPDALPAHPQR